MPRRSSASCATPASTTIAALALTGYGKDLLKDVIGADLGIVETVAHATAALHYFPDADVICDVGGCDVKIMILRQGTVADFRLNSQCSSGNGAFLQGVAERYVGAARAVRGPRVQREGGAGAGDGLRRVPAVRHRQSAAQGLVGGRDHGRRSRRCCRSTCGCTPGSSRTSPPRAASSSCRAARTATSRW